MGLSVILFLLLINALYLLEAATSKFLNYFMFLLIILLKYQTILIVV